MSAADPKRAALPAAVKELGSAVEPGDVDTYLRVQAAQERLRRLQTIVEAWEEQQREERRLRKSYAQTLMWILGVELAVIFAAFFMVGVGWLKVEQWTVDVFLVSTLAQSSSLLLIVVKYLFPENAVDVLKLLETQDRQKD